MEGYVDEILRYLPVSFTDTENSEFIAYLQEAYVKNLTGKTRQFSFKAFHMMYMVFIYKSTWLLKLTKNPNIFKDMPRYFLKYKDESGPPEIKKVILTINNFFHQSGIGESNSINLLLTQMNTFSINDFNKCLRHIEVRNHCSHCSGKIEYDDIGLESIIRDELKYAERIQNKLQPELTVLIKDYINNKWKEVIISGDIENWIIANYLSIEDLKYLSLIQIEELNKKSTNFEIFFKKILFLTFLKVAQKYTTIEKNIFLEKLPLLMDGLDEEIEVETDGNKYKKLTSLIIEEKILPLLEDLSTDERNNAEKILHVI